MKKIEKRSLTLLEVLIAVAILGITAAGIGWKTHSILEKRQFESAFQRFSSRLQTVHLLALVMQSDWQVRLCRRKGVWRADSECVEQPEIRRLTTLSLGKFKLLVDGIEQEELSLYFFATGETKPSSSFAFSQKGRSRLWNLHEIVRRIEGDGKKNLGPMHPEDLSY